MKNKIYKIRMIPINNKKESLCYNKLKQALAEETSENFPQCLKNIKFHGMTKTDDDEKECICSVKIKYEYLFYYKNEIKLKIGSVCQSNLLKDIDIIEKYPDIIEHWGKEVEKARNTYNRKFKKCKVCSRPWNKPRCFLNGLCKDCQNQKKTLGNMICIMRLYDGYKIKDIYKENKEYIIFCAGKDTKQTEEFKQYLKYC